MNSLMISRLSGLMLSSGVYSTIYPEISLCFESSSKGLKQHNKHSDNKSQIFPHNHMNSLKKYIFLGQLPTPTKINPFI